MRNVLIIFSRGVPLERGFNKKDSKVYGKLLRGEIGIDTILDVKKEYTRLIIQEMWDGDFGNRFRSNEMWYMEIPDDKSNWYWDYYSEKDYSFSFDNEIPDDFIREYPIDEKYVLVKLKYPLPQEWFDDQGYLTDRESWDTMTSVLDNWIEIETPVSNASKPQNL